MKALSIKQPWAWAILNGKPVENRTWPTWFLGAFLIHASKTFDHDGYRWLLDHRDLFTVDIPARDSFQVGGIVGKGRIVDCVSDHPSPFFFGPWGIVIKGAVAIPFTPLRGQPRFFEVDERILNK